jgi:hypothetical protein
MAGFYEYTSPDTVQTTFFISNFVGDGVTKSFTLSTIPYTLNNTSVYINGVYQEKTGYGVLGNILTFTEAPPIFSTVEVSVMGVAEVQIGTTSADLVSYTPESGGVTDVQTALRNISAGSELFLNQFVGDGTTQSFTLSTTAFTNNTLVYFNGIYQSKANYVVSSNSPALITFSTAPPLNVAVEIMVNRTLATRIGVPSDNTVTTAKITDNAVTTAKIADANVTTAKIADANVTTAKIADANVTTAKIADANVTTAKIADGSITTAKLAAGVGGAFNDFVIKTADYTAVTRDQLIVNSASARTITLPASPSAGNVVFIKNAGAGTVTVARNGSNINSTADNGELATDAGASLVFCDSTIGWKEL